MTITVIGVDLSLASTGLARITGDPGRDRWVAETTTCASGPPRVATLAARAERIAGITAEVTAWAEPCDLVVIEGPSLHSVSRSAIDRAWLWGAVVSRLVGHGTAVVELPPATRSKFVCDHGGADKAAVAMTMARMWPDWTPGESAGVNDQADALALASAGLVLAGVSPVPFAMPAYRTRALAKVATPERKECR